jgi:uncharacterized protein
MADIIDAWMQLPNTAYLLDPMFDSLRRWPTAWKLLAQDNPAITHDEALDNLLAQGVTQVIASAWWGPAGPMITNDEVAAAVRAHPRHVVGVASVDISRPMTAVRELRRCVKQLGFKGLRVLPWLWGLPPDDRRYYPLYAECVELDITFCLQVGSTFSTAVKSSAVEVTTRSVRGIGDTAKRICASSSTRGLPWQL